MAGAPGVARREQQWNERQLTRAPDAPAWRIWHYDAPALVLGCSQRRLLPEAQAGLDVLLRRAGGGAVLVGPWMLGLSVALPGSHPLVLPSAVGSCRWLGELLQQWLRAAGVRSASALPPGSAWLQSNLPELAWACFGGLCPWELVVDGGRKIAGLAQARRRDVVLLVAGVLMAPPDWTLLAAGLGRPASDAAALERRTASCAGQLGATPDMRRAGRALGALLADRLGGGATGP